MALVTNEFLSSQGVKDYKFNLKATCPVCNEEFGPTHLPKVLQCGHSLCVQCIDKILNSVQVSYVGDGEACKYFSCVLCRSSMTIPDNGASGFPTNFQLMESIAPQDTRYLKCTNCDFCGSEKSFHLCRECTIEKHSFNIDTVVNSEPSVHPDTFVTCSTCILRDHNGRGHTVIDYLPIRLDCQFKRNVRSVNVLNAQMVEKFAEVRTIMATMPILVEKKEGEVTKLVEMMARAKSSQNQELIFSKYKQEMGEIVTMLGTVQKSGSKLNEMISEKVELLSKMNEEIGSLHCFSEPINLRVVLNLPESQEEVEEPPEISREELPEAESKLPEVVEPVATPSPTPAALDARHDTIEPIWSIAISAYRWLRQSFLIAAQTTFGGIRNNEEPLVVGVDDFHLFIVVFCAFSFVLALVLKTIF